MNKKIEVLNLTAEQQDVYEEIKQDINDSLASCTENRHAFKNEITAVLNDENSDPGKISSLVKDKIRTCIRSL